MHKHLEGRPGSHDNGLPILKLFHWEHARCKEEMHCISNELRLHVQRLPNDGNFLALLDAVNKPFGCIGCCKCQLEQRAIVPKCITVGLAIGDFELFKDELDVHRGVPPWEVQVVGDLETVINVLIEHAEYCTCDVHVRHPVVLGGLKLSINAFHDSVCGKIWRSRNFARVGRREEQGGI
jgi:hypothetical protein